MMHWPSSVGASVRKRPWLMWPCGSALRASLRTGGPAWRAMASRTSARSSCSETSIEFHVIDDADDGGVDRGGFLPRRLSGGGARVSAVAVSLTTHHPP